MAYDVVVAGAGPAGLLLAAELRLGGARVLVLERDAEVVRPWRVGSMGARSVNTPTAAALHLRGLLPAVSAAALSWFDPKEIRPEAPPRDGSPTPFGPAFAGHFAGIGVRADRLDFEDPEMTAELYGAGVIAQQDLEDVLAARAEELGAEIRRGAAVTGFEADETGVTVESGTSVRAGWLVGCDGGRSTVRKIAGIGFPGVEAVFLGRQATVDVQGLGEADDWRHGPGGSYIVGGWGGGDTRVHTVEPISPVPDGDVTAEEIEASLRRVSGLDVTVTAVHTATRYTDVTRQAETYRRGRVLLAGDAAHVHSPAGGQGLNLGLGDAFGLGWRLAAVVRGDAPADLLDSYVAERHPIGRWVQEWSMAQTALSLERGPRADALRTVVGQLLDTRDGATFVVKRIAGVWQHYDLPGGHPLVGHRVPDLPLTDGSTLASHFASGRAVFLDGGFGGEVAARWADRLTVIEARAAAFADVVLSAFVRPDGYVAWAGPGDGLAEALETWLGPSARG
ncbi:FAD-dependent monooxygenase [Amycolatopsis saalfeldensis]|uniref:2-polyprenyl-6-methoxyphenol hydroxylase n=1 Tax=Amycolatopsis saalfeldensis TaxID=394193 RepID=A0A1H8Y5I5_9PSEU|nr:FAD-dependent monooxygenase [Amycolatopsis saalfeldensis]SEP47524.1 2-polyprenyl-6-methoxyphenol hydroxylase [Amycolatopsis saalfeldensis]